MALRTEFSFTLPKGFVDDAGVLHRDGMMRLSTARDEIEPLRSREVSGPDDPYLTVLVLSRVITELGSLSTITTDVVEGLFAADLAFLQDLYGIINFGDPDDVAALQATVAQPAADDAPSIDDVSTVDDDSPATEPPTTDAADAARPAASRRGRIEEVSGTSPS